MISKNIEVLCQEMGISVSGLEKQLGFGNSTIAKWSKSSPTVEKLLAVAKFFGVTMEELLADNNKEMEENR